MATTQLPYEGSPSLVRPVSDLTAIRLLIALFLAARVMLVYGEAVKLCARAEASS